MLSIVLCSGHWQLSFSMASPNPLQKVRSNANVRFSMLTIYCDIFRKVKRNDNGPIITFVYHNSHQIGNFLQQAKGSIYPQNVEKYYSFGVITFSYL